MAGLQQDASAPVASKEATRAVLGVGLTALVMGLCLFGEYTGTGDSCVLGGIVREMGVAVADSSNQWMVFLCGGMYFVAFVSPAPGAVVRGWPGLCPEAQRAVMNALRRAGRTATAWFPDLTQREHEVAGCLVADLRDKEIAARLGMAAATVHVHLERIYRKLSVHNRREAAAKLLLGAGGGEE